MERTGYSVLSKQGNDELGVCSLFRAYVERIVGACLSQNKWFGFCTRVSDSQVDIMSVAIEAKGIDGKLLPERLSQQATKEYTECSYRTAVYKYLIRDFLCYYESPTVYKNTNTGGFCDSYNKSLVTANLHVVAAWLGITYEQAKAEYGFRLDGIYDAEDDSGMCPYLKLHVAKDGTKKITKPRKELDLTGKGVRIIPVFAVKKGVELLYEKASEDFYDIAFVKDSGQPRTVNICFNLKKLQSVYTDNGKLMKAFGEQYSGDFMNVKTLNRGYIRVIEVGTCLNSGATRSINFARITGIAQNNPDTTFVNTDLDLVISTFVRGINSISEPVKNIVEVLEIMNVGQKRLINGRGIATVVDLEDWARSQEMLLSTPFLKQLALFMMANPHWFGGYSGDNSSNNIAAVGSTLPEEGLGIDAADFDLVLDL